MDVVKQINESGLIEVPVSTDGLEEDTANYLCRSICDKIITEKGMLPDAIKVWYEEQIEDGKFDSSCEDFRVGYDINDETCKECKRDFPDEFLVCKAVCETNIKMKGEKNMTQEINEPTEEVEEKENKKVEPVKVKQTPKTPGVIKTIASLIEKSGEKGITKAELLKKLQDTFTDRNPDSMKKTINVQVPNRINKEKFPVGKKEDGRYYKTK